MMYAVTARNWSGSTLSVASEVWWDILLVVRLANALDEPVRRRLYVVGAEVGAVEAERMVEGVRRYLEGREDLVSGNGGSWELAAPGRASEGRPVRVSREQLDDFLELAANGSGFRVL